VQNRAYQFPLLMYDFSQVADKVDMIIAPKSFGAIISIAIKNKLYNNQGI